MLYKLSPQLVATLSLVLASASVHDWASARSIQIETEAFRAFEIPISRARRGIEMMLAETDESELSWTVLTVAPDGSWGSATNENPNYAITNAIAACQRMHKSKMGCGAVFTMIRQGWSLGILCGNNTIIVAERNYKDAERQALARERELRDNYAPHMPTCVRIVTVDPLGIAHHNIESSASFPRKPRKQVHSSHHR